MARWVGRGVCLLILLAAVFFPAVRWGAGGDTTPDSARIVDYRADFAVDEDGELDVTETLVVAFPGYKHGIFRFFDLEDPDDSRVRLRPHDISVTRDGQPEPYEVLREGRGRYRNVKIGSASTTMTGEHTYVIGYSVDGALSPGEDDNAQFYWNLVPGGWRMPIEQSRLTVHLPAEASDLECNVGAGKQGGCTAEPAGDGFVVSTGRLEPNTPVTVRAQLDMAPPERDRSPWPLRFDPVLGPNLFALVGLLIVAAFAALLGALVARQSRERNPQFPLMYAPPDGIGPAQAAYLFTEQTSREAFVASIMQTAEKGATRLDRAGGWTITDTGLAQAWEQLDPVSAYAAQVLGVQDGPAFTADSSVEAGKTLKTALTSFDGAVKGWARQNGLIAPAGLGCLGGVLVIGAAVLALFLAIVNPLRISMIALIPGLFAIFAFELLKPGASTLRTRAGRDLWSRIGGFRRILATPSSEDRFDFSGRKELYTAYVPWAVAFGVADEWAEKYRLQMHEEPPVPSYAPVGFHHAGASGFAASMASDFSSKVDTAISAYEATQSSSSSSGGGGGSSGGGGGGGGGGGSW